MVCARQGVRGIILILVFSGILAVISAEGQQCGRSCRKSLPEGSKFKYESGSSYVYSYLAETTTFVNGTSKDKSKLTISANAEFFVDTPCEFFLQLRDVKFEDSSDVATQLDKNEQLHRFKYSLERHPLRFHFEDGVIGDLCPNGEESDWVLNFKRGVLSAFQNSMRDLHSDTTLYEKDVTGICKTDYEVAKLEWYKVIIKRTKNLMICGKHGQEISSGLHTIYQDKKTQPLIKSTQVCSQAISHSGIIHKTKCQETHRFKPFSNENSGVVTVVNQQLSFVSVNAGALRPIADKVTVKTDLVYKHKLSQDDLEKVSEESVYETLKLLEKYSNDGITNEFIPTFSTLVSQLKTLSYPQITKIFSKMDKSNVRKFLLDAMPLVGTADSMTVMRDLFMAKEISREEMDHWLTSLAFQDNPTLEMISSMKPLLNDGFHAKAMLGISSLVHLYCKNNRDCASEKEVMEVMRKIEEYLGEDCETQTRAYKEAVVAVLKSIGNSGVFTQSLSKLKSCYMSDQNPMDVRLAAVTSFRRIPCNRPERSSILNVYTDYKENTELRIASYLTAMQCPSSSVVSKVKDTLYSEEVNQVASFVWTHLTNLQETSSKWKKHMRELLEDEFLMNKFNTNVLKFSRNYEASLYSKALNAGTTLDTNIVFSPESYLPRSTGLNVTVDIFGETVNVFEVGGRFEGFEPLIESLFGESGYFPDELLNVVKNMNGGNQTGLKQFQKRDEGPKGTFYGRVFGNELYLKQIEGLHELFGGDKQRFSNILPIENIFKGEPVDYTKSVSFLNQKYTMQTVIGLPITLAVEGDASVGLKMSTDSDLEDLYKAYMSRDIKLLNKAFLKVSVNPSATIQITGKMSVNGIVTESGINSVSKLNTNTISDFKFSFENGQLEVALGTPREKMEIVDVSSELFIISNGISTPIKSLDFDKDKWDTCSYDRVPTITGLRVCSVLLYNNATSFADAPYFPLTGPFRYSLNVEKTDTFSGYVFNYQLWNSDNPGFYQKIYFDTPGSKLNRKVSANVFLDETRTNLEMAIDSPLWKYKLTAQRGEEFKLIALAEGNEVLNITASRRHNMYKGKHTHLAVNYQKKLILGLEGFDYVSSSSNLKYHAKYTLSGLTAEPIIFNGLLKEVKNKYHADLDIYSPILKVGVKCSSRLHHDSSYAELEAGYSYKGSKRQSIDFSAKLRKRSTGSYNAQKANAVLKLSAWPQFNVKSGYEILRKVNYFDAKSYLNVGKSDWHSQQQFTNILYKTGNRDFAAKLSLASPKKNIDYKLELIHKKNETTVSGSALAQLNQEKKFYSEIMYTTLSKYEHKLRLEFSNPWQAVNFNGETFQLEDQPKTLHGRFSTSWGDHALPKSINAEIHLRESLNYNEVFYNFTGAVYKQEGDSVPMKITKAELSFLYGSSEDYDFRVTSLGRLDYYDKLYESSFQYSCTGRNVLSSFRLITPKENNFYFAVDFNNLSIEKKLQIDLIAQRNISLLIWSNYNDEEIDSGLSFYWDKVRNNSQALIFHVNYSNDKIWLSDMTVLGNFYRFVIIPTRSVDRQKYTSVLEWGRDKNNIEKQVFLVLSYIFEAPEFGGDLTLVTSFSGYEEQGIGMNMTIEDGHCQFKVHAMWQKQGRTINVNSVETADIEFSGKVNNDIISLVATVNSTVPVMKEIILSMNISRLYEGKISDGKTHLVSIFTSYNNAWSSFIKAKGNKLKGNLEVGSTLLDDNISGSYLVEDTAVTVKLKRKHVLGSLLVKNEKPWNYFMELVTILPQLTNFTLNTDVDLYTTGKNVNTWVNLNNNYLLNGSFQSNSSLLYSKVSLENPTFSADFFFNNTYKTVENKLMILVKGRDRSEVIWNINGDLKQYPEKWSAETSLVIPGYKIAGNVSSSSKETERITSMFGKFNGYSVKINGQHKRYDHFMECGLILALSGFNNMNYDALLNHKQEIGVSYDTVIKLPYNYILEHKLNINENYWQSYLEAGSKEKFMNIKNIHALKNIGNFIKVNHNITVELLGQIYNGRLNSNYNKQSGILEDLILSVVTEKEDIFETIFNVSTETEANLTVTYRQNKLIHFNGKFNKGDISKSVEATLLTPFHQMKFATSYQYMEGLLFNISLFPIISPEDKVEAQVIMQCKLENKILKLYLKKPHTTPFILDASYLNAAGYNFTVIVSGFERNLTALATLLNDDLRSSIYLSGFKIVEDTIGTFYVSEKGDILMLNSSLIYGHKIMEISGERSLNVSDFIAKFNVTTRLGSNDQLKYSYLGNAHLKGSRNYDGSEIAEIYTSSGSIRVVAPDQEYKLLSARLNCTRYFNFKFLLFGELENGDDKNFTLHSNIIIENNLLDIKAKISTPFTEANLLSIDLQCIKEKNTSNHKLVVTRNKKNLLEFLHTHNSNADWKDLIFQTTIKAEDIHLFVNLHNLNGTLLLDAPRVKLNGTLNSTGNQTILLLQESYSMLNLSSYYENKLNEVEMSLSLPSHEFTANLQFKLFDFLKLKGNLNAHYILAELSLKKANLKIVDSTGTLFSYDHELIPSQYNFRLNAFRHISELYLRSSDIKSITFFCKEMSASSNVVELNGELSTVKECTTGKFVYSRYSIAQQFNTSVCVKPGEWHSDLHAVLNFDRGMLSLKSNISDSSLYFINEGSNSEISASVNRESLVLQINTPQLNLKVNAQHKTLLNNKYLSRNVSLVVVKNDKLLINLIGSLFLDQTNKIGMELLAEGSNFEKIVIEATITPSYIIKAIIRKGENIFSHIFKTKGNNYSYKGLCFWGSIRYDGIIHFNYDESYFFSKYRSNDKDMLEIRSSFINNLYNDQPSINLTCHLQVAGEEKFMRQLLKIDLVAKSEEANLKFFIDPLDLGNKFEINTEYSVSSSVKTGSLFTQFGRNQHQISGEVHTKENSGKCKLFLFTTSMNLRTAQFFGSYGFRSEDGNGVDIRFVLDEEDYFAMKFFTTTPGQGVVKVILPEPLQTDTFQGFFANFDFSGEKKTGRFNIYGALPFQLDMSSHIKDSVGEIEVNVIDSLTQYTERNHYFRGRVDLKYETEISVECIISDKKLMDFKLLFDSVEEGMISLVVNVAENSLELFISYDFLETTKTGIIKLNKNYEIYEVASSVMLLSSVAVLDVNVTLPHDVYSAHVAYDFRAAQKTTGLVFNIKCNAIEIVTFECLLKDKGIETTSLSIVTVVPFVNFNLTLENNQKYLMDMNVMIDSGDKNVTLKATGHLSAEYLSKNGDASFELNSSEWIKSFYFITTHNFVNNRYTIDLSTTLDSTFASFHEVVSLEATENLSNEDDSYAVTIQARNLTDIHLNEEILVSKQKNLVKASLNIPMLSLHNTLITAEADSGLLRSSLQVDGKTFIDSKLHVKKNNTVISIQGVISIGNVLVLKDLHGETSIVCEIVKDENSYGLQKYTGLKFSVESPYNLTRSIKIIYRNGVNDVKPSLFLTFNVDKIGGLNLVNITFETIRNELELDVLGSASFMDNIFMILTSKYVKGSGSNSAIGVYSKKDMVDKIFGLDTSFVGLNYSAVFNGSIKLDYKSKELLMMKLITESDEDIPFHSLVEADLTYFNIKPFVADTQVRRNSYGNLTWDLEVSYDNSKYFTAEYLLETEKLNFDTKRFSSTLKINYPSYSKCFTFGFTRNGDQELTISGPIKLNNVTVYFNENRVNILYSIGSGTFSAKAKLQVMNLNGTIYVEGMALSGQFGGSINYHLLGRSGLITIKTVKDENHGNAKLEFRSGDTMINLNADVNTSLPRPSLELSYSHSSNISEITHFASFILNRTLETDEIHGNISSPFIGDKLLTLSCNYNEGSFLLHIPDVVLFSAFKNESSVSVSLLHENVRHYLEYQIGNEEQTLVGEVLSWEMKGKMISHPLSITFETGTGRAKKIEVSLLANGTLSEIDAAFNVILHSNRKSLKDKKMIQTTNQYSFLMNYINSNEVLSSKFTWKMNSIGREFYIYHRHIILGSGFTLKTPSKEFHAILETNKQNVTLFVGFKDSNEYFSFKYGSNDHAISGGFLFYDCPLVTSFKGLNIVFRLDNSNDVQVVVYYSTHSKKFTGIKFTKSEDLYRLTGDLPFMNLQYFNIKCEFYPQYVPKSLDVTSTVVNGSFELNVQHEELLTLNLNVNFMKHLIKAEVYKTLNYDSSQETRVVFITNKQEFKSIFRRGNEIYYLLNLESESIRIANCEAHYIDGVISASSSFKGIYSGNLHFEIKERVKLLGYFSGPTFKHVGGDLEFSGKLQDKRLRIMINIPYYLETTGVDIFKNEQDTETKSVTVVYKNKTYSITSMVNTTNVVYYITSQVRGEEISLSFLKSSEAIKLRIKTPLEIMKDLELAFIFANNVLDCKFYVSVESVNALKLRVLREDNGNYLMEFMDFDHRYFASLHPHFGSDVQDISGKIGWKDNTGNSGSEFQGKFKLQKGTQCIFDEVCQDTVNLESKMMLSFGEDQFSAEITSEVGDSRKFNAKVVTPCQAIKTNFEHQRNLNQEMSSYGLNWGKDNAESKEISYIFISDSNETSFNKTLILHHFAFDNDLELSLSKINDNLGIKVGYATFEENSIRIDFGRWHKKEEEMSLSGFNLSILHPPSDLDFKISSNVTTELAMYSLGLLSHYSSAGSRKYFDILGSINLEENNMELNLETEGNRVMFGSSAWVKEKYKGITLRTALNSLDPLNLEISVDRENPGLEVELNYGAGRSYHVYTGKPNDKELSTKISHSVYGSQVNDFYSILLLNNSRLLWGLMEYSPNIFSDFSVIVLNEYSSYGHILGDIYNDLKDYPVGDLSRRIFESVDVMLTVGETVIIKTLNESQGISFCLNYITSILEKIYEENLFYLKDGHDILKSTVLYTSEKFVALKDEVRSVANLLKKAGFIEFDQKFLDSIHQRVKNTIAKIIDTTKSLLKVLKTVNSEANNLVKEYLQEVNNQINRFERIVFLNIARAGLKAEEIAVKFLHEFRARVNKLTYYALAMEDYINEVNDDVNGILNSIEDNILAIDEFRNLFETIQYYSDAINLVDNINGIYESVKSFLIKSIELVKDDVDSNLGEYQYFLNNLSDVIGHRDLILDNGLIGYIYNIGSGIYNKVNCLWNFTGMTDVLTEFVEDILKSVENLINDLHGDSRSKLDFNISEDYRSFDFSYKLPVDWEDFNTLPNFQKLQGYNRMNGKVKRAKQALSMYAYKVYDGVNYYQKNDAPLRNLLPSFEGTALVAGNYFITFDKSMYAFSGGCNNSYILAGDFRNNKFLITLNYESQSNHLVKKKSLTLVTPVHQVDIGYDYRVTVNGKFTELPKTIGDSLILERDIDRVIVKSKHGLSVECNFLQDVCKFTLSGWYFGKTNGLLGTFNNEKVDDFSTPDGRITTEDVFISSWLYGNSTDCETPEVLDDFYLEEYSKCQHYFKDRQSPLSSCFFVVEPEPYLDLCTTSPRPTNERVNICQLTAAYVTACQSANVKLELPQFCVNCNEGIDIDEDIHKKSSDIVFIIEENSCSSEIKVPEITSELNTKLIENGITSNRFAFVGFGGRQFFEPHIKTTAEDIWSFNETSIEKAFKNGFFTESNKLPKSSDAKNNESPAVRALNYAMQLPFRYGVSKTFILIQCGSCTDNEYYHDIIHKMKINQIHLHIIQENAIKIKSDKGTPVIGVDSVGAYTDSNGRSLVPNSSRKKSVTIPKDSCTPIALETDGSLFTLDRFGKKFLDVWSGRVAKTASPVETVTCSNCVATKGGIPSYMCTASNINDDYEQTESPSVLFTNDISESEELLESVHSSVF